MKIAKQMFAISPFSSVCQTIDSPHQVPHFDGVVKRAGGRAGGRAGEKAGEKVGTEVSRSPWDHH